MIEVKHPELLSWQRNVVDRFKNNTQEEIVEILVSEQHKFAVACEHWIGDFNMSSALRNANGFNAREFFYIGQKHFDRRGAVGQHHYTKFTHFSNLIDFYLSVMDRYHIIGIDNVPGSVSILDFDWPENTLMLFGEEGPGLTKEALELCETIVSIPMFGSVRSFNCATASGIAMYDYIRKLK